MRKTFNPFVAGLPVRGDGFFGRKDILERIEMLFRPSMGIRSIFIHGARRMGKTSLLYRIRDGVLGKYIFSVYVDLQSLSGSSVPNLFSALQTGIQTAVEKALELPATSREVTDLATFQEFLRNVLDRIKPRSLLLMFDECEVLQGYSSSSDVSDQLQHLWKTYSGLLFVFAGAHNLQSVRDRGLAQLLWKSSSLRLSNLTREETYHLVTQPAQGAVSFADASIEKILQLCGGHPFYTQLLCMSLFDMVEGSGSVSLEHVESTAQQLLNSPPPHLILSWNALAPAQRAVAAALASGTDLNQSFSLSDVRQYLLKGKFSLKKFSLTLRTGKLHQALEALAEADWVQGMTTADGATRYRFLMDLARQWIANERTNGE